MHGRFRQIVAEHSDRPALRWSDREVVTYAELDHLSDRVTQFLWQQGVRPGDRICIRLDKCNLAYALMLASLKLGAVYFFVDPANPAARVAHILEKCRPKIVFSAGESPLDVSGHKVVTIDRHNDFESIGEAASSVPSTTVTGSDPAYVMFTSGSTGFPKGAVMSHANLLNFVQWAREEFSVSPDDVFTNVNPLFFDNSVFDFYASIMNGASLVPFDADTMKDPYAALSRIDDMQCTIYFSVPSLLIYFQTLKLITPASLKSIRTAIFGGEGYPKAKLQELYGCLGHRIELVNVYGPTECTCICSAYRVTASDFADLHGYPPLGGLIPNFSCVILDEQKMAVAPGEVGELYLGGPCVGLGYFNEAELTRDAFLQNPLNSHYEERLYRTGDLVRVSPRDGKLHFVGRKDSQIKHQGYRIELGEIEHGLCRIAGVDEAVALHSARDGVSLIVAVVGSSEGVTPEAVRQRASTFLPAYMVPSRVDVVPRLPKNENGKIDRNLLKNRYAATQ